MRGTGRSRAALARAAEPDLPRGLRSGGRQASPRESGRFLRARRSLIMGAAASVAGLGVAAGFDPAARAATAAGPVFVPPSGDTTGATDTANIAAAAGSGLSAVFLLPGVYYVQAGQVTLGLFQYLRGPGKGCCFIKGASGSGPVIQIENSTGSYHPQEFAGISGMSLDATALGAGSPALQVGDIVNLEIGDIAAYGNADSPAFLAPQLLLLDRADARIAVRCGRWRQRSARAVRCRWRHQ